VTLGQDIQDALGTMPILFNDAELVALGEYYHGAGKGAKNMLYVTVSTGVGGAFIHDGEIMQGEYNTELGHQKVGEDTLENQISGTAVERLYGVKPQDLKDEAVREHLADILADGLYDNTLHFSPDLIILGGSMIVGKNPIPLERVRQSFEAHIMTIYPNAPRIEKAKLSSLGGLYGAMSYLEHHT
jgi:predicted NBD/HSP70 family sugar kinase